MLIAVLAIALVVSLSIGVYAALYKSVTTSPVYVVGLSDQLKMFVTQPYYWDFTGGTLGSEVTQLAAGHTYTIYLGVKNMLNEPSGSTYMVYVWSTPGADFKMSYLEKYSEANIYDNTGNIADYWPAAADAVYWAEGNYYGDGYSEVVAVCHGDINQGGFKLPANHWFITQMWFTLGNIPTLGNGITLTVYEYSSQSDLPFTGGTLLADPYLTHPANLDYYGPSIVWQ